MRVSTRWRIPRPPSVVWPLLCNARMEPVMSCAFGLGVPRPEECSLPSGPGGVGAVRQCRSNRGIIQQRILEWDAPRRLKFEMEKTDLFFRDCIPRMTETFDLVEEPRGRTALIRTTQAEISGLCPRSKGLLLWLALKRIHWFVFRNWERLARGLPVS